MAEVVEHDARLAAVDTEIRRLKNERETLEPGDPRRVDILADLRRARARRSRLRNEGTQ